MGGRPAGIQGIAIRDDDVVDVDVHPVYAEAFRWYLQLQADQLRTPARDADPVPQVEINKLRDNVCPSCDFATATLAAVDVREDPRLRAMVDWLVEVAQPEELILFGSRSRGEERLDSDADFLVLLPAGTTKEAIDALLLSVPQ